MPAKLRRMLTQRKHSPWAAVLSLWIDRTLEEVGIGFVDLDDAGEGFDAEVSEGHDALLTRAVDPDQAVLLVHFAGDVPQPVLVLAEHFGDAGDGSNMVDLVDRAQGQAATAVIVGTLGVQFQDRRA